MALENIMLNEIDVGGVLPLLYEVSAYAALERGSKLMEPQDLVKAIYVADLEHVAHFWQDWTRFERLVSSVKLVNGTSDVYINRTVYLLHVELMARQELGQFTCIADVSTAFQEIVNAARKLASERTGRARTPNSQDLLFCLCLLNSELSQALRDSGLQFDKLAATVDSYRAGNGHPEQDAL
jgi:hypothetical protein